ncbi:uncharacterized protein LOC130770295 [Actinidia eriantha]|uniref:uncharacterized protein LOC130770295 n=1 Tax=Actinidia eriantha TaxID=165200 RepID=UPI00258FD922|nr:uncharacterized protein LOC130770295 [Actinidia eriantha]
MNQDRAEGTDHPWGTLEELLLACAVNRHGSENWDSIAVELQRRASRHHLRAFYSPRNCKQKYRDLRRRFEGGDGGDEKAMVDELKRLRVAELRREVERRDVSIEFLQLKVKRLEEERERNFKPKEEKEEEEMDQLNEPEGKSRHDIAGKSISGEDSVEGDDRSFNESNSTSNRKAENWVQNRDKRLKHEPEVREHKPVIFDTVPVRTRLNGENAEPAESKSREEEGSGKKKQRRRSGEDEPEGNVSVAKKQILDKSEPLIKIIEIIRSHKNGSLFERRLRSQETEKYKKMVRQHMDLQTVQSKLDKGSYLNSPKKLLRDLLLIFANAVTFFPNTSPHHTAALELRQLVTKQIPKTILKPTKPDPNDKQPDKTVTLLPIVVCQRRNREKQQPNRDLRGDKKVVVVEKCVKRGLGRRDKTTDLKKGSEDDDEREKEKRRGERDGKRGRPPTRSSLAAAVDSGRLRKRFSR